MIRRRMTAVATAVAVFAAQAAPSLSYAQTGAAPVAEPIAPLTAGAIPDSCQVADEEVFRERIRAVTARAFTDGMARVDFGLIVDDQWRENEMSAMIDRLVDTASDQVREETDWDDLVASLASRDKARALAERMAERVYRTDAFKTSVEKLATDAGREIAGKIELATIDAAVPAVACVRTYLGNRYGRGIARIVADDTRAEFNPDVETVGSQVGTGDVLLAGSEAIAGTMVLLVRRTLARMARRVGQRVVGAVLSRIVSVIAGGIGVVLIAKDIWDLRHGVLPIIADEMKSDTSKESVKRELAASITEQMNGQVDELAGATADRIVSVWREFRAAHLKVVELAGTDEKFKRFVDGVSRSDLPKLNRIVALVLQSEGESGVEARLADGTLNEAVRRLPASALEIADDAGGLAPAFAWIKIAGKRIDKVAEFEIHRAGRPEDFTERTLASILDVDDRLAISRLVELGPDARRALIELETDRLRTLARKLTAAELNDLSGYITGLSGAGRDRVLAAVADDPHKMQTLAATGVRSAVLSSRDQDAALSVVLRQGGALDVFGLQRDTSAVLSGDVSPWLLWAKHPYAVGISLLLMLFAFLFVRRLLFGSRRPHVTKSRQRRTRPGPREDVAGDGQNA